MLEDCHQGSRIRILQVKNLVRITFLMSNAIDSPMGFVPEGIVQLSTMDHNQVVPIKHVKITVRSGTTLNGSSVFIKTGHKTA